MHRVSAVVVSLALLALARALAVMASLPATIPVEIELVVEVDDQR